MTWLIVSFCVFLIAYGINIFYVSVLYHRGLAHGSVQLGSILKMLAVKSGPWVTGIDPKAWACMHRTHHMYSDTEQDPHSPVQQGVFGVARGQLRAYERVISRLVLRDPRMTNLVSDLNFDVSFIYRKGLWGLPYLIHFVIAAVLGFATGHFLLGIAYFIGIMSHPFQGWMVNSLAHRFGYRNYEISDNSKNNILVSILVFGEGFQNNHHARPKSPNFAKRRWEVDFGYWMCMVAQAFRLLRLQENKSENGATC